MRKSTAMSMGLLVSFLVLSSFGLSRGQPTTLIVVKGTDNNIYKMTCDELSCSSFTPIIGRLRDAPTVTWDDKAQEWVIVGVNENNDIFMGTFNKNGDFNNDWQQLQGRSPVGAGVAGRVSKEFSGRVAIVARSGGKYTDPVTAMADLNSWCPSPSANNSCLMKIMPGTYDIGSNTLTMQPFVSIEGSGELVTRITGSKSGTDYCNPDAAIVHGAWNTEIRFLTVSNANATGMYAVGILNTSQGSPRMTNVSVSSQSSYAAYNFGIVNCPGSPEMLNVNVFAGDGYYINRGIYNSLESRPELTNVIVRSRGGNYSDGIRNEKSGVWIRNSVVWGEYGSTGSYGLSNDGIAGGTPSWTTVVNSRVQGGTRGILATGTNIGISVAYSEIAGGVELGSSVYIKCIGAYNGNFDPLNNNCQ